ncbi:MAG TPA: peptidylprolyl isomerase [Syntrophaceae bacterium]|nr:peptidylprolyl isomerase [Syntrophaceae bacterium]
MVTIGPNTTATIDYSLSLGGGISSHRESLQFRYGAGEILPKLEEELAGLSVGEEKDITLSPEDAYGEIDPRLIQVVPLEVFPGDTEVKAGQAYQSLDERGKRRLFYVKKVEGNHVTVDFNHPLAGKTLYFHVVVRDIQSLTMEKEV